MKKTIKNNLFLIIIISLIFNACSNDDENVAYENKLDLESVSSLSNDELKSLVINYKELSGNEILNIVKDFQGSALKNQKGTKSTSISFEIKNKYYINKKSEGNSVTKTTKSISEDAVQAPIYEVKFKSNSEEGLALVSGDSRYPEVIAYIPVYIDTIKIHPIGSYAMMEMAKRTLLSELESYDIAGKTLRTATLEKISEAFNVTADNLSQNMIDQYILASSKNTKSRPEESPNTPTYMNIGPLCETLWHQGSPYNSLYPKAWVDIFFGMCEYGNYPAGCAVVAMAQIMAAIEPSMTCNSLKMDWAYLKQNPQIMGGDYFTAPDPLRKRDMVGALFKDIYDKSNSYPIWGTGQSDSWPPENVSCVQQVATTSTNVYNYFNSRSGVTYCGNYQKWNLDIVKNSLTNIRPVFAGGNSHAFVVDGYVLAKKTVSSVYNYNTYLHCNFGWQYSSATGYYLSNSNGSFTFETENGNYPDSALNIIPDIRKR
ncbi:C10 family peptidase [Dysgonomonas mossii]|uniref:HTH cro/C1-type domain-containing protein n=1 Tax=Dysgonomonas mossii TaxID=163665 RepID=A0A4Y9ILI2_9BACT|nr:C10 family peptidase [Dysgonomonas mossii]MBF0761704.1 C10 family peptidase [Dysgonomonas mossii]TFU89340.1 hypothetical protein E4T88_11670 [Dysgonomonas mossii]